jgi:hypothetical protein
VALVDIDNDSVGTSLKGCDILGDRLWGVWLDTSNTLVDKSILPVMQNFKTTGITPRLVEMTLRELDKHGFNHIRRSCCRLAEINPNLNAYSLKLVLYES